MAARAVNLEKAKTGSLEEVTALRQYAMRSQSKTLLALCNQRLRELKRVRQVAQQVTAEPGESGRELRKRRRAALRS